MTAFEGSPAERFTLCYMVIQLNTTIMIQKGDTVTRKGNYVALGTVSRIQGNLIYVIDFEGFTICQEAKSFKKATKAEIQKGLERKEAQNV
jgi:hypothetical protein